MQSDNQNPFDICLNVLTKKKADKQIGKKEAESIATKKAKKKIDSKAKKEKIPEEKNTPESVPAKIINVEWKS